MRDFLGRAKIVPVRDLAVVGSGYCGKTLVRNFHKLGVLAAICESEQDKRTDLSEKYPDCEMISSFADLLKREDTKALVGGKDVFVEKPLCLSVTMGEELVNLAQEKKTYSDGRALTLVSPRCVKAKRTNSFWRDR